MIHWRACSVLTGIAVLLLACGSADQGKSIRDPDVMMSATSRYDAHRFAGRWLTRADFDGDWRVAGFDFTAPTGTKAGRWEEWNRQGDQRRSARLVADQPAVFTLTYSGLMKQSRQMAVLWVDEGFRTAVLSTRDGSYALIVDRKASGGEDRLVAARSVLEHNGFDPAYFA